MPTSQSKGLLRRRLLATLFLLLITSLPTKVAGADTRTGASPRGDSEPVASEALNLDRATTESLLAIWLRPRPGGLLVRDTLASKKPAIEALRANLRATLIDLRPPVALDGDEEQAYFALLQANEGMLFSHERETMRSSLEAIEALRAEARAEMVTLVREAMDDSQATIALAIEGLGGQVLRRVDRAGALTARLPTVSLPLLAEHPLVARFEPLQPAVPELDAQKRSLGLSVFGGFWADGFTGEILDAGVLDTGVQQNHPALDHLRFESTIGTTDADGHGTAMAGILAGNDAEDDRSCLTDGLYCGTAWEMDTMLVGSSESADVMADADWMAIQAQEDPEAINLSAGYGRADDIDYSGFDAFWDGLVDDLGILLCTSAGDGGNGTTTITHPASAYNVLALANLDDQNDFDRTNDVIAPSSSRGPTLAGRKKPDLAAPGASTRTTSNDWNVGPDFLDVGGTSAATPHCTGAALLLAQQLGVADPMVLRALLINTADTWSDGGTPGDPSDDGPVAGSEWNPTYGWGSMDLLEAHFNAPDVIVDTLGDGRGPIPSHRYYRANSAHSGEKLTLTWNRHVGYSGSNQPTAIEDLTNLDLRVFNISFFGAGGAEVASSRSTLDNVEQVAPVGGMRVAKVELVGAIDPDVGVETFAIALEEDWQPAEPPTYQITPVPRSIAPGRFSLVMVDTENLGDFPSFSNRATLSVPAGYAVMDSDNPQFYFRLVDGDIRRASWRVRAACDLDEATFDVSHEASFWNETFQGGASFMLRPTVDALIAGQTMPFAGAERTLSFAVQADRWSAVDLLPTAGLLDLWGDNELCFPSPYQTSTEFIDRPELIVANGAVYGDDTHYALVTPEDGDVNQDLQYTVEHVMASDLVLEQVASASFADGQRLALRQIAVEAGRRYRVIATVAVGDEVDLEILGYGAGRDDGDRANADLTADSAPIGGTEVGTFEANATGAFGLALLNKNRGATTVDLLVREVLYSDGFESGDTSAWSDATP